MEARPVFKNQLVFVTRAIDGQRFRLTPSRERNEIIEYLLAVISDRHNIGVVAATFMSDHYHGLFDDPDGNLPRFTAEFHANLARALNWADGRRGRLWDGKQTNQLNLNSNEVVLDKIAYTMANPVAAGAVREGKHWPGVRFCWPSKPRVVRRPAFFNDPGVAEPKRQKGQRLRRPTREAVRNARGAWEQEETRFPPYALLESCRPRGFDGDNDRLAAQIRAAVRAKEQRARLEREANNLGFLGRRQCQNIPLDATASSEHELFSLTPTFVAESAESRRRELSARQTWRAEYKAARKRWVNKERGVIFPIGTYQLRVHHNVNVEVQADTG